MLSGIVLAGGASRRMGRDKAWIEFDGKFLIVHVIEALQTSCDEVLVVGKDPAPFQGLPVRFVPDRYADTGSLGGLFSGLEAAKNELAFAAACDMPFLNPSLIQLLVSLAPGYDVVVPGVQTERRRERETTGTDTAKKRNLHPLHALYRKTCLESMHAALVRQDLRMISFYESVRVRIVAQGEIEGIDPKHLSFWNVNTPEELARAKAVSA